MYIWSPNNRTFKITCYATVLEIYVDHTKENVVDSDEIGLKEYFTTFDQDSCRGTKLKDSG